MDEKLNKIADALVDMKVDLAEIRKDLNYHIMRTDQNDEKIELIAKEIKPIQEHIAFLRYSGKLVTILAAVAGAVVALIQLIKGN
jgi:uncharacterized protein with PhoU and TrkA domain